jgi:hypothetical protein
LSTRDTVWWETPAVAATSRMVTLFTAHYLVIPVTFPVTFPVNLPVNDHIISWKGIAVKTSMAILRYELAACRRSYRGGFLGLDSRL